MKSRRKDRACFGRIILTFFVATSFVGCGENETATKTLTVFVAASLTDVIQEVSVEFKKAHDVDIFHNFASSGALAQQLLASPRADLYVSASQRWTDAVERGGRIKDGTRRTLLSNTLVVIGHPSSTRAFEAPSDLLEWPFRFLAIGDPDSVPAGRYAKIWLESVRVDAATTLWEELQGRVSPAPDVRAALAQVEGSADVIGIVYRTDTIASGGQVRLLYEVPVEDGPKIEYPAAILRETPEPELAAEFLRFLSGPKARTLFEKHGFAVIEQGE
jgi:molybdate transport system substrate-binding protein